MNFEDEHYVRIYTKPTKTVKKWGWEGRILFRELMTVVDKAGVLDDIDEPVEDVALMVDLPEEVVEVGLPKILKSKSIEIVGNRLVIPNYIEGQTARKSDKVRAQESRARRAAAARLGGEPVTDCDTESHSEAPCDETERRVTSRDEPSHVTNRDGAVTDCDNEERKRDEPSDPVTTCHPTQCNADHNNADAVGSKPRPQEHEPSGRQQQRPPGSLDEALRIPIAERAQLLIDNRSAEEWAQPHKWPEVISLAENFSAALGWHRPRFAKTDGRVRRMLELLATFTAEEFQQAVTAAKGDPWLNEGSKGLGALSPEVVSRLLSGRKSAAEKPESEMTPEEVRDKRRTESRARELGLI